MQHAGKENGVTLVELVAVMVIVGILAAYAVPRMLSPGAVAELGYTDQMLAAARYAQKLAVATHCETRVVIAAGSFKLQQHVAAADCGTAANWVDTALPGDNAANPDYPAPAGVVASAATITFLASGQADNSYTITLSGTPRLTVHALTGYVQRL